MAGGTRFGISIYALRVSPWFPSGRRILGKSLFRLSLGIAGKCGGFNTAGFQKCLADPAWRSSHRRSAARRDHPDLGKPRKARSEIHARNFGVLIRAANGAGCAIAMLDDVAGFLHRADAQSVSDALGQLPGARGAGVGLFHHLGRAFAE